MAASASPSFTLSQRSSCSTMVRGHRGGGEEGGGEGVRDDDKLDVVDERDEGGEGVWLPLFVVGVVGTEKDGVGDEEAEGVWDILEGKLRVLARLGFGERMGGLSVGKDAVGARGALAGAAADVSHGIPFSFRGDEL